MGGAVSNYEKAIREALKSQHNMNSEWRVTYPNLSQLSKGLDKVSSSAYRLKSIYDTVNLAFIRQNTGQTKEAQILNQKAVLQRELADIQNSPDYMQGSKKELELKQEIAELDAQREQVGKTQLGDILDTVVTIGISVPLAASGIKSLFEAAGAIGKLNGLTAIKDELSNIVGLGKDAKTAIDELSKESPTLPKGNTPPPPKSPDKTPLASLLEQSSASSKLRNTPLASLLSSPPKTAIEPVFGSSKVSELAGKFSLRGGGLAGAGAAATLLPAALPLIQELTGLGGSGIFLDTGEELSYGAAKQLLQEQEAREKYINDLESELNKQGLSQAEISSKVDEAKREWDEVHSASQEAALASTSSGNILVDAWNWIQNQYDKMLSSGDGRASKASASGTDGSNRTSATSTSTSPPSPSLSSTFTYKGLTGETARRAKAAGFAEGGTLFEPVVGVGKSGQMYTFAENGPEEFMGSGSGARRGGAVIVNNYHYYNTTVQGSVIEMQKLAEMVSREQAINYNRRYK